MDYVYFALFIILLSLCIYSLNRWDARTRNNYKLKAYKLLETPAPEAREVKNVIKGLRLYGGRWHKDRECVQLVERLQDKL